jgi:hypothetical protein
MNFSSAQELEIKKLALQTWRLSFGGLPLNPDQFSLRVDRPNDTSYCSIYITSNRKDDNFRLKLYVKKFIAFTQIEPFILTQEVNYGPGGKDEIFVADCSMSKTDYFDFYKYLLSPQFAEDVLDDDDTITSENGEDKFVAEDGSRFVFEF